jgi:hypothetical protein
MKLGAERRPESHDPVGHYLQQYPETFAAMRPKGLSTAVASLPVTSRPPRPRPQRVRPEPVVSPVAPAIPLLSDAEPENRAE